LVLDPEKLSETAESSEAAYAAGSEEVSESLLSTEEAVPAWLHERATAIVKESHDLLDIH
jgi:hypothetical protein